MTGTPKHSGLMKYSNKYACSSRALPTKQFNLRVMKPQRYWAILDLETKKFLYGAENKTLMFSKEDIAIEVAEQFFSNRDRWIVIYTYNLIEL